jgi:phage terminase small subunit
MATQRELTPDDFVELPPIQELGEKMRALPNDRMRRFVIALLELGGIDNTRAALLAGYKGNPNGLRVQAHSLAHDPRVLEAIDEEARRRLHSGTIMAVSVLMQVAAGKISAKVNERLKAVDMILNRVGISEKTEHTVKVENVGATDESMLKRIVFLAGQQGLDPAKLLGFTPSLPIVDAEVVETKVNEEW